MSVQEHYIINQGDNKVTFEYIKDEKCFLVSLIKDNNTIKKIKAFDAESLNTALETFKKYK